jgi:hypothetical protein
MMVAALMATGMAASALGATPMREICRLVDGQLMTVVVAVTAVDQLLATPQSGWLYAGAGCST